MIEAVIFDLDGVIVSTDDCHYKAWKKLAEQENIYFDRKINEKLRGVSRMDSLNIVLERSDRQYDDEQKRALAQRKNEYYVKLIDKLTENDVLAGVMENLKDLKQHGIKIAIGSSSKNAPLILKRIGLDTYFDAVSDGNNISKSKPDPEVFLKAASMLGVSPEKCLVVEDSDSGIAAGKKGNMLTLAVGSASGGDYYRKSLEGVRITDIIK